METSRYSDISVKFLYREGNTVSVGPTGGLMEHDDARDLIAANEAYERKRSQSLTAGNGYARRRDMANNPQIPDMNIEAVGRLLIEFPNIEDTTVGTRVLANLLREPRALDDMSIEGLVEEIAEMFPKLRDFNAFEDLDPAVKDWSDRVRGTVVYKYADRV